MKTLSLVLLISIFSMASTPAMTCNVDRTTQFISYFDEGEEGFYFEHMQTKIYNSNEIVKTKQKRVKIPILNVVAYEITHTGSEGDILSYLILNKKAYQAQIKTAEGKIIELKNCR